MEKRKRCDATEKVMCYGEFEAVQEKVSLYTLLCYAIGTSGSSPDSYGSFSAVRLTLLLTHQLERCCSFEVQAVWD